MGAEKEPSKAIRTGFFEQQNFLTIGDSTYDFRYFTYAGAPAYPIDNFFKSASAHADNFAQMAAGAAC